MYRVCRFRNVIIEYRRIIFNYFIQKHNKFSEEKHFNSTSILFLCIGTFAMSPKAQQSDPNAQCKEVIFLVFATFNEFFPTFLTGFVCLFWQFEKLRNYFLRFLSIFTQLYTQYHALFPLRMFQLIFDIDRYVTYHSHSLL